MANVYDWHTMSVSVPASNVRAFFFPPNPARVCLIGAAPSISFFNVASTGGSNLQAVWGAFAASLAPTITYRDYGPIMQGEIWCGHAAASPQTINITEIVLLSRC